jgi:hypothetical protein
VYNEPKKVNGLEQTSDKCYRQHGETESKLYLGSATNPILGKSTLKAEDKQIISTIQVTRKGTKVNKDPIPWGGSVGAAVRGSSFPYGSEH